MSDHDEPPAFTGSGDPREEALWQAYQAMLRRRKDPRPRWSTPDSPEPHPAPPPSSPARSAAPPPAAPAGAARRIPARTPEAQAAQPGPLVFQPIDALDAGPHANAPPLIKSSPFGLRWRATLGMVVLLAGTAALAIALWPHGPVVLGDPVVDAPAVRAPLPCVVGGRMIGRFTLEECASRNGVASGSLRAPAATLARAAAPRTAPMSPDISRPRTFAGATPPLSTRPLTARAFNPLPGVAEPPSATAEPTEAAAVPTAQAATAEPDPKGAMSPTSGADVEHRMIAEVPPRRASGLAVREFYDALGKGDGARAAAVVVPEKREEGPLSASALTKFYASLRAPLRLTKIDPIDDDTVFVRYQFVTADNHLCLGTATVSTAHRDGDTLVKSVHVFNGC